MSKISHFNLSKREGDWLGRGHSLWWREWDPREPQENQSNIWCSRTPENAWMD